MKRIVHGLVIVISSAAMSACALDGEADEPQQTNNEATSSAVSSATVTCHASPSPANCDKRDPVAQGCSADAVSVAGFTRSFSWGRIELRWSPSCKTNWTRFTAGYNGFWDVSVERQSPHLRVGEVVAINGGSQHYTDMVFAPGPAQACTNDVSSDNGACTGYTN